MNFRAPVFAFLALPACTAARAATFCVATADELAAALASAQQDVATNDEIRIHTGHYLAPAGGWHVDVQQRGIAIEGGFTDGGCQTRSADAALTVLDGQQAERPLTIDTSFAPGQTSTGIIVRGLTFEGGVGATVAGLKISDAGPIYNGPILVERNIFRNNVASAYQQDNSGGALLAATDSFDLASVLLVVRNNLFSGNRAPDGAAAQLFSNNAIAVAGNTVSGNQSFDTTLAKRTAIAVFTFSALTYSDNVFWANNPDALDGSFDIRADNPFNANLPAKLFNNDVQALSGTPGIDSGNHSVDPQFVDAPGGNLRLAATSPLIDAGTDAPAGGLSAADLDGSARVQGAHVDIGAYEFADAIFHDGFD